MDTIPFSFETIDPFLFYLYYIATIGIFCVFGVIILQKALSTLPISEFFIINFQGIFCGFTLLFFLILVFSKWLILNVYTYPIIIISGIFLITLANRLMEFPRYDMRVVMPREDVHFAKKLCTRDFLIIFISQSAMFLLVHLTWMVLLDWKIPSLFS